MAYSYFGVVSDYIPFAFTEERAAADSLIDIQKLSSQFSICPSICKLKLFLF